MFDWLIIGAGVQGVSLAVALIGRDRVPRDRVRLLDPHPVPLARWRQMTAAVGMTYLRSPGVHHLHFDPFSIRTFRQTKRGRPLDESIPRYERPALALFRAYTDYLLARYAIPDLMIRGQARRLLRHSNGWQVETDDSRLVARRVILAIGASDALRVPGWAAPWPHVQHIFAPGFMLDDGPACVVIGGGISAAQTALRLSAERDVTLLTRHPLRVHDFDSDPCWVTSLCLDAFHATDDYAERRRMIRDARHTGSIPPDIHTALQKAQAAGRLRIHRGEGVALTDSTLTLADGDSIQADQVVLCTGFEPARPGGAWLADAITRYDLPVAGCGYPVVDETLCWADGLYVAGALAELEIGPVARNIIGARLAGERLKRISQR
jgi:cation diffusion facilitator CzcD-associated flavoprotein CzcO